MKLKLRVAARLTMVRELVRGLGDTLSYFYDARVVAPLAALPIRAGSDGSPAS
ncbi:MAG TPA: hypothetical protein VK540_28290 [Polyangiaceae bacterium]|nr:hypothetical protein [Polyangiaceae bacterium]